MKIELNKTLDQFNRLNQQARYGIFGGLVFLVVLLDLFFLVGTQTSGISDMGDQIKKLAEDTQEVLTDRPRVGQLRKSLEATRQQMEVISAKVRPVQEVPSILSTISSIANMYGVKIDQMVPDKAMQESLTASRGDKYYVLPIVIRARCGYHMFGRFLNKLESENMFFLVNDFIIQNEGKDTTTHLFSMTIKLVLVDQGQNQPKNL